jgi:hypothetical protein
LLSHTTPILVLQMVAVVVLVMLVGAAVAVAVVLQPQLHSCSQFQAMVMVTLQ